jgi:hypothetical protein
VTLEAEQARTRGLDSVMEDFLTDPAWVCRLAGPSVRLAAERCRRHQQVTNTIFTLAGLVEEHENH